MKKLITLILVGIFFSAFAKAESRKTINPSELNGKEFTAEYYYFKCDPMSKNGVKIELQESSNLVTNLPQLSEINYHSRVYLNRFIARAKMSLIVYKIGKESNKKLCEIYMWGGPHMIEACITGLVYESACNFGNGDGSKQTPWEFIISDKK